MEAVIWDKIVQMSIVNNIDLCFVMPGGEKYSGILAGTFFIGSDLFVHLCRTATPEEKKADEGLSDEQHSLLKLLDIQAVFFDTPVGALDELYADSDRHAGVKE